MGTANYSYSKIDTYQQCPFKFKLKYLDGHYSFSDSVHTEVGTLIHSCEETIAKAIQQNNPIDYIALKNKIILETTQLQYKYPNDWKTLDKSDRNFQDKIYDYLEHGIYNLENFIKNNPTYKIVGIEQPFTINYKDNINFNGFIDRVFYDEVTNQYIIQDIKTYAVEIEEAKLATPLQLVIYALAVKELYKCSLNQIKCQYYLPFCNKTQNAGTSGYITRGLNKIDKLVSSISVQHFAPVKSPLCNYCEFCKTNPDAPKETKYLCPYFSLWDRTTRNKYDISKVNAEWQGLEKHDLIMENYIKSITEGGE